MIKKHGHKGQIIRREGDSDEKTLKKIYLLNDLLNNTISEKEADQRASELGIRLGQGMYCFLIFKVWQKTENFVGGGKKVSEKTHRKIRRELEKCADRIFEVSVLCFRHGNERCFLLYGKSGKILKAKTLCLKKNLEMLMEKYKFLDYFGGIGCMVQKIYELRDAYESAQKVFAMRFIEPADQILLEEEIDVAQDRAFSPDNLDKLEDVRTLIERFLVEGEQEEIDRFVDFYFKNIPEENFRSLLMRQYLSVNIFIVINAFYKKIGFDRNQEKYTQPFMERVQKAGEKSQMRIILRDVLQEALERRDSSGGNGYRLLIEKVEKYIDAHYMQSSISLKSAAEFVNMNPSYLSSIFSKETGKTFTEYLTEIRMEKSKELLRCSPLKVSEIAYRSGYNDPQYFSHLFKKYNDCSPKEYRQREKDADEGKK